MTPDREDEAELPAGWPRRAIAAGGLDPGLAAAACTELAGAGGNAAVFAAERGRGLAPRPLLDEAARVMRRRGAAVHHALRPDAA